MNCFLTVPCVLAWLSTETLPSAADIEARILSARKRIVRGELVIDAHDVKGACSPSVYHIWFDGDALRADRRCKPRFGEPLREILCKHCPRHGEWIVFHEHDSDKTAVALSMSHIKPNKSQTWFQGLDPRGIGLVPGMIDDCAMRGPDFLFTRADRRNLAVSAETWKGKNAYRVSYNTPFGAAVQYWTVPDWDYNIVKIHTAIDLKVVGFPDLRGDEQCVDTLETQVAQVKPGGPWFPKVCTYLREMKGQLESRQVAKIEIKSLGEPIDRRNFDLPGMDLPPGLLVMTDDAMPEKTVKQWNGKELVEYDAQKAYRQPRPSVITRPAVTQGYRVWLWVASGTAGAVALVALWRLRHRST